MGAKIDMTGWVMKEHGVPDSRLTVLYEAPEKTINGSIIWHCKCECGNECNVYGSQLRNGRTKSCGCYRQQEGIKRLKIAAKQKLIDLTGQDFGYWHVIKRAENGKQGNVQWLCQCKCGTIRNIDGSRLKEGRSQSCGCLNISYGEKKIKDLLEQNNINFKKEKTFDNCINLETNKPFRFDFYINNQYIIEYDGLQHFEPIEFFGGEKGFEEAKKHDNFKNGYCFNNNIPIIRIPYWHLKDLCIEDLLLETSQFVINKKEK